MQRKIKQQQIITELFGFITQQMIQNNTANPLDVRISLNEFETHLNARLGTQLRSTQHIYQQIRAYERARFVKLYKRLPNNVGDIVLSINDATTYQAKSFLHVGLKLALAHGLYDRISHLYEKEQRKHALNIYFSAGTESLYLARRLLENYQHPLNIYTHNLGIIQAYLQDCIHLKHIHVYTRFGAINQETYTILEGTEDLYAKTSFDVIIGSTAYIDKNGLFIESEEENHYKREAYSIMQGLRILVLTLFEFAADPNVVQHKYANVEDFDYIIVPSKKLIDKFRTQLDALPFETIISYYTYEVLEQKGRNTQ